MRAENPGTIIITRRFDFSIERVFDAWLDPAKARQFLFATPTGQMVRVDIDAIQWIDAAGDYMCIYTGDNTLILRETMKDLEKRLDPRRFQRIHRLVHIVVDRVRHTQAGPKVGRVGIFIAHFFEHPNVLGELGWRDRVRVSPGHRG